MTSPASPAPSRSTPMQRRLLWAAILAGFVSFLDGSFVTIALPAIDRELGGGIVLQQWVVDGYLLTVSALILAAGAVSDAFGRLRVLRIAIVAFAITSVACAISPTGGTLIAARLLQGVAGALLVPGSLSLIIATFEGPAQARAIGRWTAWTSVAFLAGPLVGALLIDHIGWRWVFVVTVLPAVAGLVLLGRVRDAERTTRRPRVDGVGAALTAIGLGGLTTGLIEQQVLGIGDPIVLGALIVGVLALAGFLLWNRRSPTPLVPPGLFAHGNFAAGNVATLFIYAGLGLSSLIVTVFLQQVLGLTATLAAFVLLPATVLSILLAGRFGTLAGVHGSRLFMTAGPLIAAAGFVVMAISPTTGAALWFVIPGVVLWGFGMSVTVAPLTAAVLGAVPPAQSGIGSAVNNAVARVAGLVATACVGFIVGTRFDLGSFHRGALVIAILLATGGIVSFLGIRNRPRP